MLEVTFRDPMPYEKAAKEEISQRADELDKFYPQILNCRVVVESANKRHKTGNLYNVKVELFTPDKNIVVSNEHPSRKSHEDIFVAIRDAFDAARRRLEDHSRRERGKVKAHTPPPHGTVSKLFPEEGYGFIEAPDGTEIYFHENSVLEDKFSRLQIGAEVSFVEEIGEKGPQASTVRLLGKHHYA